MQPTLDAYLVREAMVAAQVVVDVSLNVVSTKLKYLKLFILADFSQELTVLKVSTTRNNVRHPGELRQQTRLGHHL